MQVFCDIVHNGAMSSKPLLNRAAYQVDEVILVRGAFLQFLIKLRGEHL